MNETTFEPCKPSFLAEQLAVFIYIVPLRFSSVHAGLGAAVVAVVVAAEVDVGVVSEAVVVAFGVVAALVVAAVVFGVVTAAVVAVVFWGVSAVCEDVTSRLVSDGMLSASAGVVDMGDETVPLS